MMMSRSQRWTGLAFLILLGLSGPALAQNTPGEERGLSADATYGVGEVDAVNLYNGNLSITIPIGQTYHGHGNLGYAFTLVYNSNVWEFETARAKPGYPNGVRMATPLSHPSAAAASNAGLGWNLSFGRLLAPLTYPVNSSNEWMLVEGDGTKRQFHAAAVGSDSYTRDSSYMRMRVVGSDREVTSSDGTRRIFDSSGRIKQIKDVFNNTVTFSYPSSTRWKIAEGARVHNVYFLPASGSLGQRVDRVELEVAYGQVAVYDFRYRNVVVPYHYSDQTSRDPVSVPLLEEVVLPVGNVSWKMKYHTTGALTPVADVKSPGLLTELSLPTQGSYEWDYRQYRFRVPSEYPAGRASFGVSAKRTHEINDSLQGTWTYVQTNTVLPDSRESKTTVTTPLGDKSVHYFYNGGGSGWQEGLPYTPGRGGANADGEYLSQEFFDGNTLRRRVFVKHEHDSMPRWKSNRRLKSRRIEYKDDGNSFSRSAFSQWNALVGRYEKEIRTGTGTPTKTLVTKYKANTSLGIRNLYSEKTVTEAGRTERTTYCWDLFGFMTRKRTHVQESGHSSQDLVAEYTRNRDGNLIREAYHGGDSSPGGQSPPDPDPLPDPGPPSDCAPLPAGPPQYRIDHSGWKAGTVGESWYKTSGGANLLRTRKNTIDASTGLITLSQDAANLRTTFVYDKLGRVTRRTPPGQAPTKISYSSGPGVALVVKETTSTENAPHEKRVVYDGFGRVQFAQTRHPGSNLYTGTKTVYNALGWKTSVSEIMSSSFSKKTQFLRYDPFGRPGIIRPPDGAVHDVTLTYKGVRETKRRLRVGVPLTDATTTLKYDMHGRLIQVIDPLGLRTTYTYDAADRLTRASTAGSVTQVRQWSYDRRGLLLWEKHPEKGGARGNGSVTYSAYDARGHAGNRVDGPFTQEYTYDGAERLVRVRAKNPQASSRLRLHKLFQYSSGRLSKAHRYNFHDPRQRVGHSVQEHYLYNAKGLVRERRTTVASGPANSPASWAVVANFRQRILYNSLGQLWSQGYPDCVHSACTADGATGVRDVQYRYRRGFLTSITNWARSISYHSNLMLDTMVTQNGRRYQWTMDPSNHMQRPTSIRVSGSRGVNYGPYTYDGAGNVTSSGAGTYDYGRRSRIASFNPPVGPTQTFTYDDFGNLKRLRNGPNGTVTNAVNSATNRRTGVSYDTAGNQLNRLEGGKSLSFGYDASNMVRWIQGNGNDKVYVYTADDERLMSWDLTARKEDWTLRDLQGNVLRRFSNDRSRPGGGGQLWKRERDYVYRGSTIVGMAENGPKMFFYPDHLGTPIAVIQQNNTSPSGRQPRYYPFGEQYNENVEDARPIRFTGHWRDFNVADDSFDDLDYMHARYYMPTRGRFLSMDPASRSFNLKNPDSFNRYTYALNNPVKYVDPDGETPETALDIVSWGISAYALWETASAFHDQPSWSTGLDAAVAFVGLAYDSVALATPILPGAAGHVRHMTRVRVMAAAHDVSYYTKAVDKFMATSRFYKTKKHPLYRRTGNFEDANREFDLMADRLEIKNQGGGVRTATQPDGTTLTVRPDGGSGEFLATIEVKRPGQKRQSKVQFEEEK